MSTELLAQLATMSVEDMRELHSELEERLNAIDSSDQSETHEYKVAISELVEERLQHYRAHPETALSTEQLRERMKSWKAQAARP